MRSYFVLIVQQKENYFATNHKNAAVVVVYSIYAFASQLLTHHWRIVFVRSPLESADQFAQNLDQSGLTMKVSDTVIFRKPHF